MTTDWEEIIRAAAQAIAKRMQERVAEGKPELPQRRKSRRRKRRSVA